MKSEGGVDLHASPWREGLGVILPLALLAVAAFALAWWLIEPAPPPKVVIATGPEGSSYNDFAAEYAKYFADHGLELEIRKTNGSRENYDLLADPKSGVDVALVQGGTAPPAARTAGLEALCTVSFEPLFVLYRPAAFGDAPLTRLDQLKGKRVAVGKATGGTYWVAMPMLALHGIGTKEDPATTIVNQSGAESIARLKAGETDAGFYAVSADTHYILDALTTPGIRIASLKLAAGYAHHFEYLTTVQLHEGSLDLGRDVPDHEVSMVAPTTALIARKRVHKAVVQLLEQVVHKVHGRRDPLAPPGAFPTLDYTELPISADGRYYFSAQPGFLQRMLPFWLASLIDRTLILLVPLAVILIPLVRMAPGIYQWRMRARVYRWYKQLRRLDARLLEPLSDAERAADRARLEALEREISRTVKVPPSYMESFYTLRTHAAYLRDQFAKGAGVGELAAKA